MNDKFSGQYYCAPFFPFPKRTDALSMRLKNSTRRSRNWSPRPRSEGQALVQGWIPRVTITLLFIDISCYGLLITLVGYGRRVCHCCSMGLYGSPCSELFPAFTPLLVPLPNDARLVCPHQPSSSFSQLHANPISRASCRILCARPVTNRDDDRMLAVLLNMLDLLDSQQLTVRDPLGHAPQPTSGIKRSSSSKVSLTGLSK
jgi:hypothetical protein